MKGCPFFHGHMTMIYDYKNLNFEQKANLLPHSGQKSSENPVLPMQVRIFLEFLLRKAHFLIIRQLTGIHVFDTL